MSQSGPTAANLVNTASREELARILREYGEEPYAWGMQDDWYSVEKRRPLPPPCNWQMPLPARFPRGATQG